MSWWVTVNMAYIIQQWVYSWWCTWQATVVVWPHLWLVALLVDKGGVGDGEPLGVHQEVVTWLMGGEADGDPARECLGREVWMDVQLIVIRNDSFWQTEAVFPWSVTAPDHTCGEDIKFLKFSLSNLAFSITIYSWHLAPSGNVPQE